MIAVEAYTPIARFDDRLVRLPALKKIAQKHNKSVVQVVLRWHIQNGLIPVVRSLNKKRQLENISVFDFELTKEEMQTIDGFNINSRLRYDPDNCDFSIL
jgi:diketogulonate reductase-like aldo/keto reductase